MALDQDWYSRTVTEALDAHGTQVDHGITREEAQRRIYRFGRNAIEDAKRKSPLRIFLSQFADLLVIVLMVAAVIAGFLGEPEDIVAIVAIVVLNAILGFVQEFRAEKAMEALQALSAPQAKVRRQGEILVLPAYELVPGDIVLLEAGNMVPADLRLVEAFELAIDESTLTGESVPVGKHSDRIQAERVSVGDQKNMAFKGTVVTAGRATGVVVRTGMATEFGRIAKLLKEEVEVKTPLQARLAKFGKGLALIVIGLCAVIFSVGISRGEEPGFMFLTAVSLMVAGIPEALPAVVTVSLAIGARSMSRRNALIRKLPAVEALGSVTVICSDKTGTLTLNRMTVGDTSILGEGSGEAWVWAQRVMALSNDVDIAADGSHQGDPTETALVRAALEAGFDKRAIESEFPRIGEVPFSSERGMMSTIHRTDRGAVLLTKGSPERIFQLCVNRLGSDGSERFDADAEARAVESMASRGYRVLALAMRAFDSDPGSNAVAESQHDLSLIGLVGLMDPPRAEAKDAIALCKSAGIRVVMITGDHPSTAQSIAGQLGIVDPSMTKAQAISGRELAELSDEDLARRVRETTVFARVAPEQKIRIVKSLQSLGEIVSMTGDGVNDAPALRRADVGVSMGKGGTDVAREASHVILLDDNFATIVAAVREGRRIYDNIRKFVRFALSGNSGEIWALLVAPFLGLPTPLLPIQILWVNLVTDGLPGLALALEPEEKRIMKRKPRAPSESMFAHGLWQHTVWVGILFAIIMLGTLAWAHRTGQEHWQSMAFTVLVFAKMGHVLAIRSETESLFSQGLRSNLALTGAVILTLILQLCTLYVPRFNPIFKTAPLTVKELLVCVAVSSTVFIAVEIEKAIRRRRL